MTSKQTEIKLKYDIDVRPIQIWNQKLEHMLTILEAEEEFMPKPLDEF